MNISIDEYIVMPNHIHIILIIHKKEKNSISKIISTFLIISSFGISFSTAIPRISLNTAKIFVLEISLCSLAVNNLSLNFLSLLKSYTKFVYTPSDEHIELPALYRNMILSSDMSTLSGIFAKAPEFSTNELMYIDNAYIYMTTLLSKSKVGIDLMEDFFNDLANNTNEEVSE